MNLKIYYVNKLQFLFLMFFKNSNHIFCIFAHWNTSFTSFTIFIFNIFMSDNLATANARNSFRNIAGVLIMSVVSLIKLIHMTSKPIFVVQVSFLLDFFLNLLRLVVSFIIFLAGVKRIHLVHVIYLLHHLFFLNLGNVLIYHCLSKLWRSLTWKINSNTLCS